MITEEVISMQKAFQVIFHAGMEDEDIDSGIYQVRSEKEYSEQELRIAFQNAHTLLQTHPGITYNGYLSIDTLIQCVSTLLDAHIIPTQTKAQYCIEQWH